MPLAQVVDRSILRLHVVDHSQPPAVDLQDLHRRHPWIAPEHVVVALRGQNRGDLLQPVQHHGMHDVASVEYQLHALGKYRDLVSLPIYGGQPYERQFHALARGVQVVVGTPGRLLDHLSRRTLKLDMVRTVVLDEADEMLSMGFIEDIQTILEAVTGEHQTALFSATLPPRIIRLAQQHQRDAARVSVASQQAIAPRVRQVFYEV